jgi:hypothetical protein
MNGIAVVEIPQSLSHRAYRVNSAAKPKPVSGDTGFGCTMMVISGVDARGARLHQLRDLS